MAFCGLGYVLVPDATRQAGRASLEQHDVCSCAAFSNNHGCGSAQWTRTKPSGQARGQRLAGQDGRAWSGACRRTLVGRPEWSESEVPGLSAARIPLTWVVAGWSRG